MGGQIHRQYSSGFVNWIQIEAGHSWSKCDLLWSHINYSLVLVNWWLESPKQIRDLMALMKKSFENMVGKGENAGLQHSLLFPQYFLPFEGQNYSLWILSIWSSLMFCCLVKSWPFTIQSRLLTTLKKKVWVTLGKGENAGKRHFLLFQ